MIEYTETGPDGDDWTIAHVADIRPFLFGNAVVPDKLHLFDFEEELRWEDAVYAWRDGEEEGHEVVDNRSLHFELPSEEELEAVRERRREEERELWETWSKRA